jgi:predicted MFS family arabinose efflux permease
MGPLFCNWIAENKWFDLARDPYRPLHFMLWFTVAGGGLALVAFLLAPKKPKRELSEAPPVETVAASEPLYAAQPLPVDMDGKGGALRAMLTELKLLARFSTSLPLILFIAPMLVDKAIITTMLAAVPEHGKTLQLNERVPPYLLAALGGFFAVCQPIAGWFSDRTSPRRLVFSTLLGMTGALIGLAIAWNEASFIPFFCIYAIFASFLMTVSMKQVTSLYLEKEGKGRVAGVVLSVTDIGTVLGPTCYMWVYGHLSPALCFITMALTGAAATAAFWFSEGREKDMPTV